MSSTFELTEDHVKLARKMYVSWWDCETGAPCIDPKRPYGNSYVPGDVAEILGYETNEDGDLTEDQEERAIALHEEMQTALQVILSSGSFEPGSYAKADRYGNDWKKVDV